MISAEPNDGYKFVKWNDDSTANPREIRPDKDVTYTAYFEKEEEQPADTVKYTLTVLSDNEDYGTVSGGGEYEEGASVQISATAKQGYKFTRWNDDNEQNPRTIIMPDEDITYTAYFEKDETPGPGPEPGDDCEDYTLSESFKSGFGTFTAVDVAGAASWESTSQYGAKMSGYNKGNNEDWLVSPALDFKGRKSATVQFSHAINYATTDALLKNDQTFWVSTDYNGSVQNATWQQVTIPTYPPGNNWTYVEATVNLDAFIGNENVVFAFKYVNDVSEGSPTWEIKDLTVTLICAEEGQGPSVGSEADALAGVRVYPNPSDGRFTVEVGTCPVRAEIYAENGSLVRRFEWNECGRHSVDLRGRTAGIYFVRVTVGEKSAVKRVVVR